MKDFKLTDLSQLDWVSYDDVDKILQTYEETRAIVEYRLRQMGDLTDATVYKKFDELLGELKQSKERVEQADGRRGGRCHQRRDQNNYERAVGRQKSSIRRVRDVRGENSCAAQRAQSSDG